MYLNYIYSGDFMNSRQLRYAVQLAKVGSFSKLAEMLNVSQPALSKQILSLEKELGVKLFKRTSNYVTPTPAGNYFIKEAQQILYKEDQLVKSMMQYKSGDKGEIVIGATPFRSSYLLPSLVKALNTEFAGLQVKLIEEGSELLRRDAREGKFDIAIVNLPVDDSALEVIPLESDHLVLAVPDKLCKKYNLIGDNLNFAECEKLPFVVVSESQEMRVLFEKLCVSLNVYPEIVAEVTGLVTALEVAKSGIAATLLPKQFVESRNENSDLMLFEINDSTSLRQPAVVRKKGQYQSEYANYAINYLTRKV